MGTPREPKPAKYFVALLSSDSELLAAVETDLAAIFGFIDARSEIFPWSFSRFYEEEMDPRLLRRFVSFEPLASPDRLADFKLATQRIEDRYRSEMPQHSGRRLNLDPGCRESGKVSVASTNHANH